MPAVAHIAPDSTVDLVHQLAARLVVVDLDGLRGPLVAVEPIEHPS